MQSVCLEAESGWMWHQETMQWVDLSKIGGLCDRCILSESLKT